MLFVVIVVVWLVLVAVLVAVCGTAARSDQFRASSREERVRAGASEHFAAHSREGQRGSPGPPPLSPPAL